MTLPCENQLLWHSKPSCIVSMHGAHLRCDADRARQTRAPGQRALGVLCTIVVSLPGPHFSSNGCCPCGRLSPSASARNPRVERRRLCEIARVRCRMKVYAQLSCTRGIMAARAVGCLPLVPLSSSENSICFFTPLSPFSSAILPVSAKGQVLGFL